MNVKEITFGFGYTMKMDDGGYVKSSYSSMRTLEPGEVEEEIREELAEDVIQFVVDKITGFIEELKE